MPVVAKQVKVNRESEFDSKARAAIAAYTSGKAQDAEKLWQEAFHFAVQNGLNTALVRQATAFGDKQSLYGDFESAAATFDRAISAASVDKTVSPHLIAALYAKAAFNQTNYDEKLAGRNFKIAVEKFESADGRDYLEYADCLNQYGRSLQRIKKYDESISMQEKALAAYAKVTTLADADLESRVQGMRLFMVGTPANARGEKRENLRDRVSAILGYPARLRTPSLKDALAAMHQEGLEIALTLKEARRLASKSNGDDTDGSWLLLEALRARFEKHQDWSQRPTDSIIVYPMPFGVEDVQACFDYFCKRAGEKPWFRVISANDLFEPLIVETGNSQQIEIERYDEVDSIVTLINNWLQEKGDPRYFFALDSFEDEGVYYLLNIEIGERLNKKGVLPFKD